MDFSRTSLVEFKSLLVVAFFAAINHYTGSFRNKVVGLKWLYLSMVIGEFAMHRQKCDCCQLVLLKSPV